MAARDVTAAPPGAAALRALGVFWVVVLALLGAGAATLHLLGPPPPPGIATPRLDGGRVETPAAPAPPGVAPAPAPAAPPLPAPTLPAPPLPAPTPPAPAQAAASAPPAATPPAPAAVRAPGAPVPPPDPALLEPSGFGDGTFLPRVVGGRAPMRAYAAGAPAADAQPRVAVLLADFGMREADSEEALRLLPPGVSLVVSPYSPRPRPTPGGLLERAREKGHELLVSLPMEPRGYPLYDPGDRAMLTGEAPERNAQALRWALSRIGGYVGATGALGGLRGERFAASEQMGAVLEELGRRGLLYVDPRPEGRLPEPAGAGPRRAVDVILDEPAVRTEIDARLARLEQLARDRGTALGLVSAPAPVTVERLAAWASLLAQRGVVLVPVSALVVPPP